MTVTLTGKPVGLELCVLPTTAPYGPNTNSPAGSENPVLLHKASVPLVVTYNSSGCDLPPVPAPGSAPPLLLLQLQLGLEPVDF